MSGGADESPLEIQCLPHALRQMFGLDPPIAGEHDSRAEALLELAHVEGPVVKHERSSCVERKSDVSHSFRAHSCQ